MQFYASQLLWGLDKIVAIFQIYFQMHFLECKYMNFDCSSLKFLSKGPINNIPSLVQIMAWRRPGDKPLSEPMMVSLLAHTCITRPQWVNAAVLYPQYMPHIRINSCSICDIDTAYDDENILLAIATNIRITNVTCILEYATYNKGPTIYI